MKFSSRTIAVTLAAIALASAGLGAASTTSMHHSALSVETIHSEFTQLEHLHSHEALADEGPQIISLVVSCVFACVLCLITLIVARRVRPAFQRTMISCYHLLNLRLQGFTENFHGFSDLQQFVVMRM